ncbi:MAG: NADH-quinone oxidoreductase subunit NuoF [Deltaproteobacteria bacterium]|jgi:NADH-quinone oxidoreductase subunit F|nr:NADH-quinone oxidoreductase subunit NuoF [Deltaproteobacteria bacterium]
MRIVIGKGSCGVAAGAGKAEAMFRAEGFATGITGCIGMCYLEPIVDIYDHDAHGNEVKTTYVNVNEQAAREIINRLRGREHQADAYRLPEEDAAILAGQKRIALRNCGIIDPEQIAAYTARGGYAGLKKALSLTPEAVIEEVKISGLAGRGGAGFPTWFKWNAAKNAAGEEKYAICNADEGDPGAFMDRAIIEGDPHAVIEGMLIGAYAMGSSQGVVYVRAEYPLAIVRLDIALEQARSAGYLGRNILDSGFDFDIRIKAGAGAFVCGEETALIASLEGERGMPRLKPPFPAQKGFWQKPSNINNVETYANVPWIFSHSGQEFADIAKNSGITGAQATGTKVFALTGKITKGGLVEVPIGMTIKDVIFAIGGGIPNGKAFKAVQLGGPSGGCIPAALADTVIDYQSLAKTGAIMGSGGMVVMDEDTCMVDMARFFLDFTCKESCGKCTHCRIGTKRMLEVLSRITAGDGKPEDIETLEQLGSQIKEGSLCGLGQTAPNPVLTTLRYFKNEYMDHIVNRKCTARQCKTFICCEIDAEQCKGCGLCKKDCPTAAISGEKKKPHTIRTADCVACKKCKAVCKFNAVKVSDRAWTR